MVKRYWDGDSVECRKCKIRYSLLILNRSERYIPGVCPKCGAAITTVEVRVEP